MGNIGPAYYKGLKNTFWPGRMEQVRPGIYLDGAHNPGGIEAFIQTAGEISDRRGKEAMAAVCSCFR